MQLLTEIITFHFINEHLTGEDDLVVARSKALRAGRGGVALCTRKIKGVQEGRQKNTRAMLPGAHHVGKVLSENR